MIDREKVEEVRKMLLNVTEVWREDEDFRDLMNSDTVRFGVGVLGSHLDVPYTPETEDSLFAAVAFGIYLERNKL